jgi:hypothetical protein
MNQVAADLNESSTQHKMIHSVLAWVEIYVKNEDNEWMKQFCNRATFRYSFSKCFPVAILHTRSLFFKYPGLKKL